MNIATLSNEELKGLASRANALIAEEFELWGLPGDAPQLTPMMLRIIARVLPDGVAQAQPQMAASNYIPSATSSFKGQLRPEVVNAIVEHLKHISINGVMPTQAHYEKNRGELPCCSYIRKRGPEWEDLARLTGLEYGRQRAANEARLAKHRQAKEAGAAASSNGFHRNS